MSSDINLLIHCFLIYHSSKDTAAQNHANCNIIARKFMNNLLIRRMILVEVRFVFSRNRKYNFNLKGLRISSCGRINSLSDLALDLKKTQFRATFKVLDDK